jgi:hypothetical protein
MQGALLSTILARVLQRGSGENCSATYNAPFQSELVADRANEVNHLAFFLKVVGACAFTVPTNTE